MMTLTKAARELGVDIKTLRRWLARAEMGVDFDPLDDRPRLVADADVVALARIHGVTLRQTLEQRLATLEARVQTLEARLDGRGDTSAAPRQMIASMPTRPLVLAKTASKPPVARSSARDGLTRMRLPEGYISVSRYLDHHSQVKDHPLQLRNILRATAEGHIPPSESPPEGVDWRSDVNQRVQHAYSEAAHLAVSCYAAATWPDLYQSCDTCRAAVETRERVKTLATVAGAPDHEV